MYAAQMAADRSGALALAQALSRRHGHATVTNREGLVATYVNGTEWRAAEPAEQES